MQQLESANTPQVSNGRLWRIVGFITVAVALFLTIRFLSGELFSEAQKPSSNRGTELEQCANSGSGCDTAGSSSWQTGNLNQNNSAYAEGDSVPYRATFTGLGIGETYLVTIEWDSLDGGKHAIDYLTTYTRTEPNALACDAATCGSATAATAAIPADASLGTVPQVAGSFSLFGATFTPQGTTIASPGLGNLCSDGLPCPTPVNPTAYTIINPSSSTQKKQVTVYFTAQNSTAVLAWGGHIASESDWGAGMSASSINGSPYHMRLVDFRCTDAKNCSSGNKDVSMSAAAITPTTTTTTIAATTTTAEATTTTVAVTTTAPPVVTTAPPVVTTAPPVVTTVPADLQIITPTPDESPDFQQEFPDELASTGFAAETIRLMSMMAMLLGGLLLVNRAFRRLALKGGEK